MSPDKPSLAHLRTSVFKHSAGGPEIGSWPARRLARPSAVLGTWAAVRLGASADSVTAASALSAALGAVAIGAGSRRLFVAGTCLQLLAYWLDHVDGQVARWRGTAGVKGVYLDYLMHHAQALGLGFALGFGLSRLTGELLWSLVGFLIAAGWTFLSLHNDCRYKAFFQRLKRDSATYRVIGGSGDRPGAPMGWPSRGLGRWTWPASKACEPHGVLAGLVGLSALAVVDPSAWTIAWKLVVATMAALAPSLAMARIARAARRDAPGAEFARWFRVDG